MRSKTNEAWLKPLKSELECIFARNVAGKAETKALDQAIKEILEGTRFCLQKKLDLSVALSADFSASNWNGCILAKNHPTLNYLRALESFGITPTGSSTMGFARSDAIVPLLYDPKWNWAQFYTALWKTVARFFQKNPQFLPRE
jgi:hypothetical protein